MTSQEIFKVCKYKFFVVICHSRNRISLKQWNINYYSSVSNVSSKGSLIIIRFKTPLEWRCEDITYHKQRGTLWLVVNPIITKSYPNKLTLSATEFANIYELILREKSLILLDMIFQHKSNKYYT